MLSIGALSRATTIPVETLRTWERRYGYPVAERKPSGHRVYPVTSARRLRRISRALASGHRAREVVGASDADLRALLGTEPASPPRPRSNQPLLLEDLLGAVHAFDAEHLTRRLVAEWARRGPLEFLDACVAPLLHAVGTAWEEGRLAVRHEHFLSERVSDLLRTLRLPYEERATGPLLVLTTLPGEAHSLGLHMVALLLAISRCRVLLLGPETPPPEVAALARDLRARAVGVSVSSATGGPTTARRLRGLRKLLPKRTLLLVGGDGAPRADRRLVVFRDLPGFDRWMRDLTAGTS